MRSSERSVKELKLLKEFCKEISDLDVPEDLKGDEQLVRWLIARDWNVPNATFMFRKSLEFRRENDIDNVLSWRPPVSFKCTYENCGEDCDGCPVVFVPFGAWRIRDVVEAGDVDILNRVIDHMFATTFEKMKEISVRLGRSVTQFIQIWDMSGFRMNQLSSFASVDMMLSLTRRYEDNYPEAFKLCYIINVPKFFSILFNLLKPLFSNRTMGKVKVYDSNQAKWKRVLLSHIPEDHLPTKLGGTNDQINLPKDLDAFQEMELRNDDEDEGMISVTVDAGDKIEIQLDVKYPNSLIKWSFKTEHFDIGFCITYNDNEEVLPFQRCDSHMEKHQGSTMAWKPGKYMVVFDNTCNPIWTKTLHCMVTVANPADDYEIEFK